MKSLTVQGIEEWLFSNFYLQTNKHLKLRDNLLYTFSYKGKILYTLSYKGKMAAYSKYISFLSWEEWYHNFIDLQQYKKRLLLRCKHHFKSDWINNMDHMRISGTEPSSVILSQTK